MPFALFSEIWSLLVEMAPYLLFGFFVAGILHVLIPNDKIYAHLSKNNFYSVLKASLFGVPLPLCSCGVIPVAAYLRKEGAGKGPVLSFLISTPTTGVDSILATYSLLGILFAIIRPVAALFGGVFGGLLTNFAEKEKTTDIKGDYSCNLCDLTDPNHNHSIFEKIKKIYKYAFSDLIRDVGKWLVIGVVVGGLISYFVPHHFVEKYLGNPFMSYTLMALIGIPMYVCATGSIPIAASLIMKGMSPGAGIIFLILGPATNTATISFVYGKLGRKSLIIYLGSLIVTAMLFAILLDSIWNFYGRDINLIKGGMVMLPQWFNKVCAFFLIFLIVKPIFVRNKKKEGFGGQMLFKVPQMTCDHCKKVITDSIKSLDSNLTVRVDLERKEVSVDGNAKREEIIKKIKDAGYDVKEE